MHEVSMNEKTNEMIASDAFRVNGQQGFKLSKMKNNEGFMCLYYFRKTQGAKNKIIKKIYNYLFFKYSKKNAIEIPQSVQLGKGTLFVHPYCITINSMAKCGNNLTMLKGSTIGNAKGKKNGAPVIGNDVYIGLNATVVGNIVVGDDVLIAANSFVNFDVPSHSVVIGNPGVIHSKEGATSEYISNRVID